MNNPRRPIFSEIKNRDYAIDYNLIATVISTDR